MVELTTSDKLRRTGIALLVVACAGGLAVAGFATREVDANGDAVVETGDPCAVEISGEGDELPECDPEGAPPAEVVEQLFPPADSEALQQVQVGVDLGPRYTGVLVVAGEEVPESQLVRQEELNQVFFSPGDEQVLEEWGPGRNCVQAIVWPILEGRSASRTIDWCFEVT